jgi:hypothetical protein
MADSKDCRDNAALCIGLAKTALDTRERSLMFEMAKEWLRLAAYLECNSDICARYQHADVPIKKAS